MLAEMDIINLIKKFEDTTLPKYQWTHMLHLMVAIHYLKHYSFEEAYRLLRKNIMRFNKAKGTPNNAKSGYHETITVFWLKVLSHLVGSNNKDQPLSWLVTKIIKSPFAHKDLLLHYYSRKRLNSRKAREKYLEPDLRPLDLDRINL